MLTGIRDYLPRQLALNDVRKTEEFVFKEIKVPSGESEYKKEYTLSKAPIKRLNKVTATVDGKEKELTEGEGFVLQDNSTVIFNDSENRPDLGTTFQITYTAESILSRYIDSIEEQTEYESDKIGINPEDGTIDGITASKYISTAEDESLDEIGELFGDLGLRAGRDTERYREYLKSIAKVYNGRGTKDSVAEAVATIISTDEVTIDPETISFREFFEDNEYNIRFEEFKSHRVSLLYDITEVADPSGVRFIGPIYNTGSDDPTFIEGPKVDPTNFERYDTLDDVPSDFIDPIGPKEVIRLEWDIFDDSVTSEQKPPRDFEWAHQKTSTVKGGDGGDWNQFQWGENNWDSPDEIETEITGDEWEFADWNRITSQGTFGPYTDSAGITDTTSTTVSDRNPDSKTVTTDDVIVRFLVGQEDISITESVIVEIVLDVDNEKTIVTDNTSIGEKVPTINDNWSDDWDSLEWTIDGSGINIQPTGVTDSNTSEVESTTSDTASINDNTVVDVGELAWGNNWNETLVWA